MCRPHDPGIVDGHVSKKPVEVHVLLGVRVDQIMIMMAGDGEHWLTVELCIIETIQQVNPAESGCSQANTQLTGVLGISASHQCSSFFVTRLNKTNFVLATPKCFHDAVNPIAGQTKNSLNAP